MSAVRMCDTCDEVFSEREEGWTSGTETGYITNPATGKREQVTLHRDTCRDCNEIRAGVGGRREIKGTRVEDD